MKNFKRITDHVYKAFNQNGFNNALYDFFGAIDDEKKEVRQMVQNYPAKYPSTFLIVDQSFECCRVYIEVLP